MSASDASAIGHSEASWWPSPNTRTGVMHDGCNYLGSPRDDEVDYWFCSKCGASGLISVVNANG